MTTGTDVIVAGGGIIGLSTAWQLAHAGLNVILLEAARRTGLGASRAGAGILMPLYPWQHDARTQARVLRSIELYHQLIADLKTHTGKDASFCNTGMLVLDSEEKENANQWAKEHNQQLQYLDSQQCSQLQPQVHAPAGGLWLPDVYTVDNPALLRLMATRLRQLGVKIIHNCELQQLQHDSTSITAVATSKGTYQAGCYVLATGAHSNMIAGIELPVRPVKGQMLAIAATRPNFLRHIVLRQGYYLVPRRNRILVGSTIEETGFDNSISSQAHTELMTAAEKIMPSLKNKNCRAQWAGLRPGSENIITGKSSYQNLYLNTGHYRNGLALAPGSAELIAELVLQDN